jgi:hypothetical protein
MTDTCTLHIPRLVLSKHVRGTSILDRIADAVNVFCGSMYVPQPAAG